VQVCTTACEEQCNPACGGATPICSEGRCVQCVDAGDCGDVQQCDASTGMCTGGETCPNNRPILWQGECVQCVANTDCPEGQSCNQGSHTCASGQCASCAPPYPACVQIGNDSYCVQCSVDEDCGVGGTCNQSTYACEGGTTTPTEKCLTDADCDPGTSGYTLHCDKPSGRCYAEEGLCDEVTAFCVGSDGSVENCVSLLEIFGGAGGGLPEIPGGGTGGATIPGFCGCSTSPAAPLGNCRNGALCIDFALLLDLFSGGSGSQPGGAPNAVCFDLGF
jgi:Cys-rich repeat protein